MASAEETFQRVQDIVAQHFDVDSSEVTLSTNFRDDMDADSLDLAELIMYFEEKFEVGTISEDDASTITTVGDAVNYLSNAVATG